MKFFKINGDINSIKYPEPRVYEESNWKQENLFMNQCFHIHELPIKYNVENNYNPLSYPLADSKLVSEEFYNIIRELNLNYKSFESELYLNKKDKLWDNYYTIIFPEFELFNWEYSEYRSRIGKSGKKHIMFLKKLILDGEKIKNMNFIDNFFVLKELPTRLICTEKAKLAIEKANLTGINFEELEVR